MCDADKPFICSLPGCGGRFTTEDHLNVHMKKHEMSLAVHPGGPSSSAAAGAHVADQTPTPTKFLKNCEEITLFQELPKNPFEEAFKKASDVEGLPPLPGPQPSELNTPVLPSSLPSPSPSSSTSITSLKPTSSSRPSRSFALDLSGQKARESTLMLRSSSERGEEGRGGSVCVGDSQLSSSSSSIFPLVSATEVMLGQGVEEASYAAGSMTGDGDQSMTSASAAVPQCTCSYPQVARCLCTSPPPPLPRSPPSHRPPSWGHTTRSCPLRVSRPAVPKVALKQRLKQSLQAQTPQSDAISPASSVASDGTVLLSPLATPISTSTQLLLNSPSSSFNVADLEPVSKRPKNGSIDTEDPVERRQKFLERNRAAAARCRHKRKQWIVNLEKKAEELQQTNCKLQGEVGLLKGEVAQLKTLLLAHQHCPITMHKPISMDSSPSMPLDIGQLISPGTSTPTLTPVDSQDMGVIDPAAFAVSVSTSAEN